MIDQISISIYNCFHHGSSPLLLVDSWPGRYRYDLECAAFAENKFHTELAAATLVMDQRQTVVITSGITISNEAKTCRRIDRKMLKNRYSF